MKREITQRELRNESGAVMRALDAGTSFVVTRNGVPVADLAPVRRRRFVSTTAVVAAFRHAPALDLRRFRADLDAVVDLLIAATAVARGLPLYTHNPDDFAGLDALVEVMASVRQ